MSTLNSKNGKLLCAVDEFRTFIETMESNAKGSGDGRAGYISLWSAAPWQKNNDDPNGQYFEILVTP